MSQADQDLDDYEFDPAVVDAALADWRQAAIDRHPGYQEMREALQIALADIDTLVEIAGDRVQPKTLEKIREAVARAERVVKDGSMEWIDVNERLPKFGRDVWVVIDGIVQKTSASLCSGTNEWVWANSDADNAPQEVVTHWMPLPEGPVARAERVAKEPK